MHYTERLYFYVKQLHTLKIHEKDMVFGRGRGDCNQNTQILIKHSALSINIAPFSVIIVILYILVSRTWLIRKEIATDIFSKIILLFNTLINWLMLVHSSAGLRIRKISNFTCMYVCHERQFVALNIHVHAFRHLWSWNKMYAFSVNLMSLAC